MTKPTVYFLDDEVSTQQTQACDLYQKLKDDLPNVQIKASVELFDLNVANEKFNAFIKEIARKQVPLLLVDLFRASNKIGLRLVKKIRDSLAKQIMQNEGWQYLTELQKIALGKRLRVIYISGQRKTWNLLDDAYYDKSELLDPASGSYQDFVDLISKQIKLSECLWSIDPRHETIEDSFLTMNPELMQTLKDIKTWVARSNSSVMIFGPSGSGKEEIAKMIHNYSPRKDQKFIAENVAALAEGIMESELFGHKSNAFNNAQERQGLLEEAHLGTIFLDEIGDASTKIQASLLRIIETGAIRRIGSNTFRDIDIRLIAATNQLNLREDLFFRLAQNRIYLPPLQDHKEDIPLLLARFLQQWQDKQIKQRLESLISLFIGIDESDVNEVMANIQNMLSSVVTMIKQHKELLNNLKKIRSKEKISCESLASFARDLENISSWETIKKPQEKIKQASLKNWQGEEKTIQCTKLDMIQAYLDYTNNSTAQKDDNLIVLERKTNAIICELKSKTNKWGSKALAEIIYEDDGGITINIFAPLKPDSVSAEDRKDAHKILLALQHKTVLPAVTISRQQIKQLQKYSWPGNVRQLRTVFHSCLDKTLADHPKETEIELDLTMLDKHDEFYQQFKFNQAARQPKPKWASWVKEAYLKACQQYLDDPKSNFLKSFADELTPRLQASIITFDFFDFGDRDKHKHWLTLFDHTVSYCYRTVNNESDLWAEKKGFSPQLLQLNPFFKKDKEKNKVKKDITVPAKIGQNQDLQQLPILVQKQWAIMLSSEIDALQQQKQWSWLFGYADPEKWIEKVQALRPKRSSKA